MSVPFKYRESELRAAFAELANRFEAFTTVPARLLTEKELSVRNAGSGGVYVKLRCRVDEPRSVLFIALPQFTADATELGTFMPRPVSPSEVVEAVEYRFKTPGKSSQL